MICQNTANIPFFYANTFLTLNMNFSLRNSFFVVMLLTLGVIVSILLFSAIDKKPVYAFYFWESGSYSLSNLEYSTLDKSDVKKLYVKFFEVEKDVSNTIIPISKSSLYFSEVEDLNCEIVPTIYIQNSVFKNVTDKEINELAENCFHLIEKRFIERNQGLKLSFNEIQIDCDWTISTQINYFKFLKAFHKEGKFQLSATLRLYPYKFPDKMGILPVDRAMLMCYNLISPLESNASNSILEFSELKKYLIGAKKYPVPLDVAFPIYSAVHHYNNSKFDGITYVELENIMPILGNKKGKYYDVIRDTNISYQYFRKGSKVKLELMDQEMLRKASDLVKQRVSLSPGHTVALFHLQDIQLKNINHEEIPSFFSHYSN